MDKSEEYIKMCAYRPLQKNWKPKLGDFVLYCDGAICFNVLNVSDYWFAKKPDKLGEFDKINWEMHQEAMGGRQQWLKTGKYPSLIGTLIWLPRQDQIQEILREYYSTKHGKKKHVSWWFMLAEFDRWRMFIVRGIMPNEPLETPEQLWLAFYMHKEYSKIWNYKSGNWVKLDKKTRRKNRR